MNYRLDDETHGTRDISASSSVNIYEDFEINEVQILMHIQRYIFSAVPCRSSELRTVPRIRGQKFLDEVQFTGFFLFFCNYITEDGLIDE
jgi:hypothetical protein